MLISIAFIQNIVDVGATPGLSGGSGGVEGDMGSRQRIENTSFENNNRLSSQSENNISCSNNSHAE